MTLSTTPEPQTVEWWHERHQLKLKEKLKLQNQVDLLFLGDSITHSWEDRGVKAWQHYYAHRNPLNLGYSGDRTEHLLWRLQQGEVDGLSPKLIILLIGTNNTGHRVETPEDTASGVKAILNELRLRMPNSKILLLAAFPRSKAPTAPMRQRVNAANALVKKLADEKHIFWLDIGHVFLTDKGLLLDKVMPDYLHLTPEQYWVWAEAMEPKILALF